MPRPSLKDTRSVEILDAFMRCVARYGLDGSTLARISEEAGVARPLLRHYLGNRDEMVQRLLDHVLETFDTRVRALFDTLPQTGRVEAMMDALFDRRAYSPDNATVFAALVAASDRYPEIRSPLLRFVYDFEARVGHEISCSAPGASDEKVSIAASGLSAIYFNTDAVMPLRPRNGWRDQQRAAAQMLVDAVRGKRSH